MSCDGVRSGSVGSVRGGRAPVLAVWFAVRRSLRAVLGRVVGSRVEKARY